ncbi:hypothetical protein Tco_0484897 [Tanacetum coccineum]
MNNLEKQLNNEILHEKDSKSALCVIKVQLDKLIHSETLKSSNFDSNAREARQDFKDYTQIKALIFKDLFRVHGSKLKHRCSREKRTSVGLTDQNAEECDDERVALANLIANLKLDVDGNKNIQKQLKKTNTSLAHELKECKSILAKTSRTLRESNNIRDTCQIAL